MEFTRDQVLNSLTEWKLDPVDDPVPKLTSQRNTGLSGFTSLLSRLLKSVMPEVTFTSAWPQGAQVKETMPAITYKVISRQPTKNIKQALRQTLPDPDIPGQEIEIYGQFFDIVMEFSVWSDRSYEADGIGCDRNPADCPILAHKQSGLCNPEFKPEICPYSIDGLLERFEDFMIDYSGVFMGQAGVQQLYLLEQGEDNRDTEVNPPLMKRTLRYFMRVEKIRIYKTADLENVDVKADVID